MGVFWIFIYISCISHRLAEKIFYRGHKLELKVVTAYENLPLHFNGNIFQIHCQSDFTKTFPSRKFSDAGWQDSVPKETGLYELNYNSKSNMDIDKLASVASKGYLVTDENTTIFTSNDRIYVSWDGCAHFEQWSVTSVPNESLILNSKEFEACIKNMKKNENWPHIKQSIREHGTVEKACQNAKFQGKNKPNFTELQAQSNGYANFMVESEAFVDFKALNVETQDYGKTWKIEKVR